MNGSASLGRDDLDVPADLQGDVDDRCATDREHDLVESGCDRPRQFKGNAVRRGRLNRQRRDSAAERRTIVSAPERKFLAEPLANLWL
ncbi:hypothetical protein [Mesorhizobium sp.]|uniref:hypothetical protein n=1 Tax=Mesorhizobium sp. TaxID=1871066 RepID=UPI000FE49CDA|nr:hypothetical protein [Mesorhizobium sp.]RWM48422.1 MAG: hypothetical protein EOR76_12045 [Mesorhizobium sp.]RWM54966.1 MAG: hypothetical protein EOR78_17130 [Mesorhizobium sp.]RWM57367.1 MAG: hypothetical protein EOR79_16965 [Mesorhizobium sp.]TIO69949.1 MAG: hypothetical protein E5X85_09370 [Mesorhizobium sp.]TJV92562.1 MAG: hypothetical protein E5X84_06635 [Mesorhizobium sp.]